MTAMQATITTLTTQLAEVNAKLVDSLTAAATLKAQVATLNANAHGGGGGGSNGGGGARGGQRRNANTAPLSFTHYCWTHGPKCGHPSAECTRQAEGHQVAATATNMMNGRTTKWRRYGGGE